MKTVYDIVIRPIISEQSMEASVDRKYTFEVDRNANKLEIKNAVEKIFDVKVEKVNTAMVKAKPKRQGRTSGYTRTWKKAIVKLTPDSKELDFLEGI